MALKASAADPLKFREEELQNACHWKKLKECLSAYFQQRAVFCAFGDKFHIKTAEKTSLQASLTSKLFSSDGASSVKVSALLQDDKDLYEWLKKERQSEDVVRQRLEQLRAQRTIGHFSGRKTFANSMIDVGDGSKNVPEEWCAAPGPVTRSSAAASSSSSSSSSSLASSSSISASSASSSASS
jgi:hypothetical protein